MSEPTTDPEPQAPQAEEADGATAQAVISPLRARLSRWGVTCLYVLVVVVLIALVRTFVLQTFIIPSGSMQDTLTEGDRVAVPMFNTQDIHRGDVVVFVDPGGWLDTAEPTGVWGLTQDVLEAIHILPEHAGHHLIKRVIGMPGDHVVADGRGSLTVNGVEINEPYLKPGRSASDVAFDVVVPEGHVWVMGDNRSNSADSRYHRGDPNGGFVPLSNVVGVAKAVVWPVGHWSSLSQGREALAEARSAPAQRGTASRPGHPLPAA
ncbi:signal peptidase I [Actinomyces slackii]|uniref:Signal peptidase I n=1 Tax=Actinomyces slackii TaxID=52774 RepID=A0A448KFC6_9ACTO|nr:signal peptidase I [Actinomyces slackii]VEG75612.1 Signal peptidase I U [Actinomyces slackii]